MAFVVRGMARMRAHVRIPSRFPHLAITGSGTDDEPPAEHEDCCGNKQSGECSEYSHFDSRSYQ
jgi:hypothetical protein